MKVKVQARETLMRSSRHTRYGASSMSVRRLQRSTLGLLGPEVATQPSG